MFYQIALCCKSMGGVWVWVTKPIDDPIEAEIALDYYTNKFHSDVIDYVSGKDEEELQAWLTAKNAAFYAQNTPTKRANFPEQKESGPGGDKDEPYTFTLPESWAEREAWIRLAHKYHSGEFKS